MASEGVACAGMPALLGGDGGRSERRIAWRASRAEQQGFELEVDEVEAGPPSALASDAVVVPAELPATTMMAVSDVAAAPAELPTVVTWAAQQGFQLEVDEVDDAEEALPSGLPSDAVVAAAEVQVAAAEVQAAAMVVSDAVAALAGPPAALIVVSGAAAAVAELPAAWTLERYPDAMGENGRGALPRHTIVNFAPNHIRRDIHARQAEVGDACAVS